MDIKNIMIRGLKQDSQKQYVTILHNQCGYSALNL
jgi:hypothetical protein